LRSTEFSIVLGSDLARALGACMGEKVMLITQQDSLALDWYDAVIETISRGGHL
jgi:ABC-type lipoprotein release transport system permease subunit